MILKKIQLDCFSFANVVNTTETMNWPVSGTKLTHAKRHQNKYSECKMKFLTCNRYHYKH